MTLYASTLTELSGFALDPIEHDSVGGQTLARIVLIDLRELPWDRARDRRGQRIGRSDARESANASALAVAAPAGAQRQSGARMKRRIHSNSPEPPAPRVA